MSLHLDHIIILIPYSKLVSPPDWLTKNFTLTTGGQHADNKTENKLIIFRDGSYIELISFIDDDPKKREGHWWGDRRWGVVDWALTTRAGNDGEAERSWEEVEARLSGLGKGRRARYENPVEGGRKRPDGKEVKWSVTFPFVKNEEFKRGELPFFCFDRTPRELRVPFTEESVSHPCGAYGVKELHVYVPEAKVSEIVKAYGAILGVEEEFPEEGKFRLERLKELEGTEKLALTVGAADEDWQFKAMDERGGVLLGDLVVGGKGLLDGLGVLNRIDPEEEEMGRVFLSLERPTGSHGKSRV